jgi:ATP-dependent Clp protease protease subunit
MKKTLLLIAIAVAGVLLGSRLASQSLPEIPASYDRPAEATIPTPVKENASTIKITNLDLSRGSVVLLADEVNTETANAVIEGIREANSNKPGKPIFLLLDSPGGSVLDGARIISTMQASKAPVYTVCLQICASMAAMILEYGKERYAVDRAIIMFHPASVGAMVQGELDKVVSRFTFLQRYVDKMDIYTAQRAGTTYAEFKAKTSRELWIDAEDALASNLIDKVVRVDISTSYDINFENNTMREHIQLSW